MVTHHIAFRVDASSQIGTGHFMRCLTLADSLKERGAEIRFVSRHLAKHLCTMLVDRGCRCLQSVADQDIILAGDVCARNIDDRYA